MEHLENDMDDLFQKAGELYPLKTTGSDWDAVAGKLQKEIPGEVHDLTGPTAVRARNKRKWLLLLLLFPLGLGINYYAGQRNPGHPITSIPGTVSTPDDQKAGDQKKINSPISENSSASAKQAEKSVQTGKIQIQPEVKNAADISNRNAARLFTKGKAIHTDGRKSPASDNIQRSQKASLVAGTIPNTKNHKLAFGGIPDKQKLESAGVNNLNAQRTKVSAADKTESELNSSGASGVSKEPEASLAGDAVENHPVSADATAKTPAVLVPATAVAQSETAAGKNKTDKTESVKKVSQDSSTAKKKTNAAAKQSGGFYVSLFAGPDFSAVKFQDVHQVGSGLGISVGYRFNKLSVETGLIWDQKYYYSSGEYFKNSPQTYYPPNTTFNGHCDMFEIPLLARYDFSPDKKSGFFAKAGFSSYLMTHQYYSKKINGVDSGSWPWTESANYFFSIVQLSGGYEFSIGAKTKIQVEPYIKIPLRGLGEGNMPISSAGIYFGITHSFR